MELLEEIIEFPENSQFIMVLSDEVNYIKNLEPLFDPFSYQMF